MEHAKIGPIGPTSPQDEPIASPSGADGYLAPTHTVEVERTHLALNGLAQLRPSTWHDRDAWDFGRIQDRRQRDEVPLYQLVAEQAPATEQTVGFLELERHADGSVGIIYLGIARGFLAERTETYHVVPSS